MIDDAQQPSAVASALELLTAGDPVQAENILTEHCRHHATDPDAWYLLGAALHAQKKPAAALARMERSLDITPDQPEVLKATAILLLELNRYKAGLARAEKARALAPDDPRAWLISGAILEAMGKGEEGLASYDHALALRPDWQPARINRGALLLAMGRHGLALENNRVLVTSEPLQVDSHFNLAESLLACGDYAEAETAARRAMELNPWHVGACIDLALSLCMQGHFEASRNEFQSALSLDRDAAEEHFRRSVAAGSTVEGMRAYLHPEDIFLWQHGEMQKSCDWRHRAQLIQEMETRADRLASGIEPALPFPAVYFHSLSLPLDEVRQSVLARGVASGVMERASGIKPARVPTHYRGHRGPLRIGYISPDYCLHPVAYLHWRQMALHDRDRFRVYAYSLGQDDGSEIRDKVKSACDEWRSCDEDPIQLTAARIRYDGIQVLVDLSGYTRDTRPEILALRPAPVQVAYMGMPATSGASFIDYRITDEITTPRDQAEHWTEKLVYLPDTLFMYNNRQEIAPAPRRIDMGLPEEAFVFCCFNNAFKIEPDVFGIWMRLLRQVKGSVLWLLSDDETVRDNLRREAESRGVEAGRLVFAPFLPFEQHLARYAQADLFLDTFYYGAHTTAADALWCGLPVLTCKGRTMAARQAGSIVNAAGVQELIVESQADYEALALRLASQPAELAGIRQRLHDNRRHAPLFDTEGRVRYLECALEMMWARHAAELPPAGFSVSPVGRVLERA
jgi:predicted O-linked N-acetylglucosamine transferase (SPINDLY family)